MFKENNGFNNALHEDLSNFARANSLQGGVSQVRRLEEGFSSDLKYIVQNEGRAILVRCFTDKDHNTLTQQINFVNFLKRHQFPVPTVVGDINPFEGTLGLYIAYEFVEGTVCAQPNALSLKDLKTSGELLARLHLLSDEYGVTSSDPFATHLDVSQQLEIIYQVGKILSNKETYDRVDESVVRALPRKKEALQRIASDSSVNKYTASLPHVMTHGDYHGANIVFNGEEVKALIDWEDSIRWPRIAEVQASIAMNCKTQTTEHFNSPIDLARAKVFLDAYQQRNPLSVEEKKFMAEMSQLDALRLDFILVNHYLRGRRMDKFVPTEPSSWFWWEDNIKRYKKEVLEID